MIEIFVWISRDINFALLVWTQMTRLDEPLDAWEKDYVKRLFLIVWLNQEWKPTSLAMFQS